MIENRPGAGGNTGIDAVAKSEPDGYTLGAATVGHFAINPFLYSRMPFDPERDIIPVSLTWELPNVAVVSSQHVPARTLQEFIDWAKARDGGIAFGSPGIGTSPHLSGVLFTNRTGIKSVHVPFRGAAQTIPAMLSGDVTFAIDNLASYMSIIESGQMRALAVTSSQRWPTMPNVPTMAEAGVPDFVVTSWAVLVVPSGTPRPIVDRLSKAMQEIAAEPAIQSRFLAAGGKITVQHTGSGVPVREQGTRDVARGGAPLRRQGGLGGPDYRLRDCSAQLLEPGDMGLPVFVVAAGSDKLVKAAGFPVRGPFLVEELQIPVVEDAEEIVP